MLRASVLSEDPATNLQLALGVELAVLPPYLYALWSIRPGASAAAAQAAATIRAVVYEEMLHAGLVANLLNALGVEPQVREHLVTYPGPLPGHEQAPPYGYTVALRPLSAEAVATFLKIEQPDWEAAAQAGPDWITIGELYDHVRRQLEALPPGALDHGRQLPGYDNPGPGRLISVVDLPSALYAIETVVDQGEGHRPADPHSPPTAQAEDDDDHEVAHYYQFQSIAHALDQGLIDPERDLHPLIANPDPAAYTPAQQAADRAFNALYTELLDSLQATLATARPRAYGPPTELMGRLEQRAAVLREAGTVPGTGLRAGPTFTYLKSA